MPKVRAIRIVSVALLLLMPAVAPIAHAGAFSVAPVRIYMKARDRAVAITVINEGTSEIALQADVNEWIQSADGTDGLRLTEDLLLVPPLMKLAPQARQVVRLALLRPADASRQLTYRLIIREVPEATAPKDNTVAIPLALALSMPVFITPPGAMRAITCDASAVDAPALTISCANSGTAHAQVREILVRQEGQVLARFEGGLYILPGARKSVPLQWQHKAVRGSLQLDVRYDDGQTQSVNVELP